MTPSSSSSFPVLKFPAVSSRVALPRRAFVKGLALAPLCLGLARLRGADAPATAAPARPASNGPIGRTISLADEMKELKDSETGAKVMLLTGGGSDNVHPYFTSEAFVSGSDHIVFGSNRTGKYQHYLMDIRGKKAVQLTDGAAIGPTMSCLSANGQYFYFDGPVLRALKLDTLEDREIYRVPDGFDPQLPTCTQSGDHVAFAYRQKQAVTTRTGVIYSDMAEIYHQHPPCVIMRIQTKNGLPDAVWGETNWISHVLIHPTDPNQIVFCHEGGGLVEQRMFFVNAGGGHEHRVVANPLYPMRSGEFTVHEYFTRQGEVGFQYEVNREGKMEYYNAFIRTDGTWIRQYRLPGPRPGHIQSNSDNSLCVGDRGFLSADDKTGSRYMSLMKHGNGIAYTRRLCQYQPGPTQFSHGHPVFSRDDQWVVFNSRLGPKENIAMADVTSLA